MNSFSLNDLPVRDIYRLSRNCNIGDILRKDAAIKGTNPVTVKKENPIENEKKYRLDSATLDNIKTFSNANADEKPRYFFLLHEKMDGILTAFQISRILGNTSLFLEHGFAGESSVGCIKQEKLLKVGLRQEIIQKKPFFSTENIASLLKWIIPTIFSFVNLLIALYTAVRNDKPLFNNISFPLPTTIILFILSGILAIYFAFQRVKEINNLSVNELKEKIKKMTDTDFCIFINNFIAEDYNISGLGYKDNYNDIICTFSVFTFREKATLFQYLTTNTAKENWWILLEQDPQNNSFILSRQDNYRLQIFRILPLTFAEKRKLATRAERDIHVPGLKQYGVDYIANTLLNNKRLAKKEDEEAIKARLDQFIERNQNQFPINIPRVIRIVAELSTTYHIDFTFSAFWENLFNYSINDPLTVLDKNLTKELKNQRDNKEIPSNQLILLISLILSEFEPDLCQIVNIKYGPQLISKDIQLTLIKTIRCANGHEERCLAIAECLYNQLSFALDNPEILNTDEWIIIIEEAFTLFKNEKFGWYNSVLLHLLLELWEKYHLVKLKKLLCKDSILEVAREQIFFYNQEIQYENGLDVIKDHAQLLTISPISNKTYGKQEPEEPNYTCILNLTNDQRKLYALMLNNSDEQLVSQYYQIIYELFISKVCSDRFIICRDFYPEKPPNFEECVKRLFELVVKLGENRDCQANEGCELLSQILFNKIRNPEIIGKCLFYMAYWEALGFSIGSFAAALVVQETDLNIWDKETHTAIEDTEIRIDMGNITARMVYLVCLQTKEGGFLAKQAIELTDILTSFYEPSLQIIGYILNLTRYALPEQSNERLNGYFLTKKSILDFSSLKGTIKKNDLSQYISEVMACSILDEETKKDFFRILLDDYDTMYKECEGSQIIKEFLYRYVKKQPSERYTKYTTEALLKEAIALCPFNNDIIYLLYIVLFKNDKETAQYCYLVKDQLLSTTFAGGDIMLIGSWKEAINKYPSAEDYISIANSLLDHIELKIFIYNGIRQKIMEERRIIAYKIFITVLNEIARKKESPYYEVFKGKSNTLTHIMKSLNELNGRLLILKIEDIVRAQKWAKLPLLTCISYMLEHAAIIKSVNNNKYISLDTHEKRIEWLKANVYELQPIIERPEGLAVNQTYIELLRVTIQENDKELTEKVMTNIEKNITYIVKAIFDKEEQRNQIIRLIEIVRNSYNTIEL